MSNEKFDLIIANPPYGKTGTAVVKKLNEFPSTTQEIILIPLQDMLNAAKDFTYDESKTFNTCKESGNGEIELLQGKDFGRKQLGELFTDASIINLFLWKRGEQKIEKEEIVKKFLMWIPFKPFYEENEKKSQEIKFDVWSKPCSKESEIEENEYREDGFFITDWNPNDGVHETAAKDRFYNLGKAKRLPTTTKDEVAWRVDRVMIFPSVEECQNFIHWVYFGGKGNKPVLSDYIYSSVGLMHFSMLWWEIVFPRINWKKEGVKREDYTDEYVLSELGLKWKDEKDFSKGVCKK